jgi:hypothetical protein
VKICTPVGVIGVGKEEHQMRMPVAGEVAQVSLFRHHESHRAGFQRCRAAGDDPLCSFKIGGKDCTRGGEVEAYRCTKLGIPELGIVKAGRPGPLDQANKTILTLECRFVTVIAERQNAGIA